LKYAKESFVLGLAFSPLFAKGRFLAAFLARRYYFLMNELILLPPYPQESISFFAPLRDLPPGDPVDNLQTGGYRLPEHQSITD